MFWKNKTNKDEGGDFDTTIDFTYETDDTRQAFRVTPLPGFSPLVVLEDKERRPLEVWNISEGGFCIVNEDTLKLGDERSVSMVFPVSRRRIFTSFKVIAVDEQGNLHCHFSKLSEKTAHIIYRYVLEVQKRCIQQGEPLEATHREESGE